MFAFFSIFSIFACSVEADEQQSFDQDIDASDIPNPNEELTEEEQELEQEKEEEFENAPAETIEYSFGDEDSLLYVQVWKDPDAAASGFAHDHVVRATGWDGLVSYNKDDIDECHFSFEVPVEMLSVDEDSMRALVGYEDTISQGDRGQIRGHMLADNQLNAEDYSSITFNSTNCEELNGDTLQVTGDMFIAGTSKSMTIDLEFNALLNSFYVSGEINFTHSDFNITPYSAFFGAVRNAEPLRITLDMIGSAI